uniref:Uncharacterized protein n=1 Tax=Lactuca sativa TaxID=4236 RepID=A0A9R1X0A6_LACSA|nr:hypothetical protein LSAT_V11C700382760 [Lactuca sativa]
MLRTLCTICTLFVAPSRVCHVSHSDGPCLPNLDESRCQIWRDEVNKLQRVAYESGLTAQLGPFLTRVLLDDNVIHRLVASTICHCEECDKVPSGDLFYMRCLTQIEVCPYLPFALAIYVFGMTLGSFPSHTICGGHWVTHLALSYEVDTSGMIPIPIRDMSTIALGKMRVLV